MDTFYLTMGCYGITMILVQSKIMAGFRDFLSEKSDVFKYLLNCMMCAGFWVGFLSSMIFNLVYDESFFGDVYELHTDFFGLVFDGAYISAAVFIIYLLQLNLEKAVKDAL